MHVMRALIGIHRLQIDHVAHHREGVGNAVAAMHVTRRAGDIQRLAAIVALDKRDHFRRGIARVHQAAHRQAGLQAKRDLGQHVGQFLLVKLGLAQRFAELFAVQAILAGRVETGFCRAHNPP